MTGQPRVRTTHVGSLPRPPELLEWTAGSGRSGRCSSAVFLERLRTAVEATVRRQLDAGLDIVGDGEMSRPSFVAYVYDRLSGFDQRADVQQAPWWAGSREQQAFPEFYAELDQHADRDQVTVPSMVCTGPISYVGHAELARDLDNLRAAAAMLPPERMFMTATSPSNVEDTQPNEHYSSQEEYLFAIAAALREEYRAIIDAGFLLQIDDPRIATYYTLHPDKTMEECRRWATVRVEALNQALAGLPRERIRFHTCFSIDIGPRVQEMDLRDVVGTVLRVNAGAYSFEAANPRHEHEWEVWREVELDDDTVLIPGVVTHSTVLVEHPDLVTQRIARFASVVGPERVIAGVDCGFAAIAAAQQIHPSIVWAKLAALVEGARRASVALR